MKKAVTLLVSATLVTVLLFTAIIPNFKASADSSFDYSKAFKYSILFFDANRCGKDVAKNNVFDWRSNCHTEDGRDVGLDLTGGYHDAGDHVKFGLPQGYTASVLAWSYYEFKDSFIRSGNSEKFLDTLKRFTDYFLKSHPSADKFYYQVGDGDEDHRYWGAPENQTCSRPTLYVADSSNPASDVLGETSAALSLMYLNYKDIDSSYANKCLKAAKELYDMGVSNKGFGQGQSFYQSGSFYDDLAWASVWLYIIEKDSKYLNNAKDFVKNKNKYGDDPLKHKWTMCWDDMYIPVYVKLVDITGDKLYADALDYNMDFWKNQITTSPGGLKYLSNWGALRYSSSASFIALMRYKQTKDESLKSFAKSQIDYILGKNPTNMSYVIGFGSNWPKHPHHRAANGYTYADGGNQKEAKHLLLGALVGGPDSGDKFIDDVNQFQYTEVALDYNAGFVAAMAGLLAYSGPIVTTPPTATKANTPTAIPTSKPTSVPNTPTLTPTPVTTIIPAEGISVSYVPVNDWNNGATMEITINNNGSKDINNWTLSWEFTGDQKVTNLWGGTYTQSGNKLTVINVDYNSNIPVGGSIKFGFNISYSGNNTKPQNVSLNGIPCKVN